MFTRYDLVLIVAELALVGLFLISLATGTGKHIEALQSITGGPYTMVFWVLFVGIGLVIPLLLEMLEMRGLLRSVALLAPVLVLIGGYALRQVMIDVGQESTWTSYPSQYSAEMLERLERN
jgi:formate-dependent nitrite reductase membrane component NrfD